MPLTFSVTHCHGQARCGNLILPHAELETPAFMPVGTQGTVKAVGADDLEALGYKLILGNTYHLSLRPGLERIRHAGGLRAFSGWDGAILTDSGGFQVFSLASLRTLSDAGVEFRSHIDGSLHFLGPREAIELQEGFGVDIAMCLDICPPGDATRDTVARAVEQTTVWARRCLEARQHADTTNLFGIVQGGIYEDLRRAHAQELSALPFDGLAIGGVSVGEEPAEIARIVALTAPLLPKERPRYLMGVGTPKDIALAVAAGIDLFDCVMPTRNARNGQLFTDAGPLSIKRAEFASDLTPVESGCTCFTCRRHTRAYLRHLYLAREILYYRLATVHNLAFYQRHMARLRAAIQAGTLDEFVARFTYQ